VKRLTAGFGGAKPLATKAALIFSAALKKRRSEKRKEGDSTDRQQQRTLRQ